MTEQTPEVEPVHELFFVSRDGANGQEASSSEDMSETGVPGQGWPPKNEGWLRVTPEFYREWVDTNTRLSAKLPVDPDDYLRPAAGDVLEPYAY